MAAVIPVEGQEVLILAFPKGICPATLYIGLFTSSHGPASVPDPTAVLGSLSGGFAEVQASGWSTYARQAVGSGAWSASYDDSMWTVTGRATNPGQVTFPATTGAYIPANPVVGYFIADALTGGHAITYANFEDTVPITALALGDTVKVTPGFGYGN